MHTQENIDLLGNELRTDRVAGMRSISHAQVAGLAVIIFRGGA
jgi:hypothetical protein